MKNNTRQILCVKDMMAVTGKSKATIWRLSKVIRQQNNKQKRRYITVTEFCEFLNLEEEKVLNML